MTLDDLIEAYSRPEKFTFERLEILLALVQQEIRESRLSRQLEDEEKRVK